MNSTAACIVVQDVDVSGTQAKCRQTEWRQWNNNKRTKTQPNASCTDYFGIIFVFSALSKDYRFPKLHKLSLGQVLCIYLISLHGNLFVLCSWQCFTIWELERESLRKVVYFSKYVDCLNLTTKYTKLSCTRTRERRQVSEQ